MSKYKIKNSDYEFALEFKKNLFEKNFYHSPSLQRILNLFRSNINEKKYVLYKPSNKKIWYLANLPKTRGQKIKIHLIIFMMQNGMYLKKDGKTTLAKILKYSYEYIRLRKQI